MSMEMFSGDIADFDAQAARCPVWQGFDEHMQADIKAEYEASVLAEASMEDQQMVAERPVVETKPRPDQTDALSDSPTTEVSVAMEREFGVRSGEMGQLLLSTMPTLDEHFARQAVVPNPVEFEQVVRRAEIMEQFAEQPEPVAYEEQPVTDIVESPQRPLVAPDTLPDLITRTPQPESERSALRFSPEVSSVVESGAPTEITIPRPLTAPEQINQMVDGSMVVNEAGPELPLVMDDEPLPLGLLAEEKDEHVAPIELMALLSEVDASLENIPGDTEAQTALGPEIISPLAFSVRLEQLVDQLVSPERQTVVHELITQVYELITDDKLAAAESDIDEIFSPHELETIVTRLLQELQILEPTEAQVTAFITLVQTEIAAKQDDEPPVSLFDPFHEQKGSVPAASATGLSWHDIPGYLLARLALTRLLQPW